MRSLGTQQLDIGERLLAANPGKTPPWWDVHEQEGYVDVRDPEEVFYNDCPPHIAAWASARLEHQSPGLVASAAPCGCLAWNPEYVHRLHQGRSDPRSLQEHMASRAEETLFLDSSHSPFLSQPDTVANLLRVALQRASTTAGDQRRSRVTW